MELPEQSSLLLEEVDVCENEYKGIKLCRNKIAKTKFKIGFFLFLKNIYYSNNDLKKCSYRLWHMITSVFKCLYFFKMYSKPLK